ncbi:hypothetical protein D3C78_1218010 [compost metagenome]
MTFLENVADRALGEGACGDQTLFGAFDGQVRGGWHGCSPLPGSWTGSVREA